MSWGGVHRYFKLRERILGGTAPAWLAKHKRRARITLMALSCVPWPGNMSEVRRIYKRAKRLGLEVDHIIPLAHPYVCGLTVAANLQLLPAAANAAKGNKWHPDQVEAWPPLPPPHQPSLPL